MCWINIHIPAPSVMPAHSIAFRPLSIQSKLYLFQRLDHDHRIADIIRSRPDPHKRPPAKARKTNFFKKTKCANIILARAQMHAGNTSRAQLPQKLINKLAANPMRLNPRPQVNMQMGGISGQRYCPMTKSTQPGH